MLKTQEPQFQATVLRDTTVAIALRVRAFAMLL